MSDQTKRRIEELANEIAREARARRPGFKLERVEWDGTTAKLTFRLEGAFRVEVLVAFAELQTDEFIRNEIRSQLQGIVPGFGS